MRNIKQTKCIFVVIFTVVLLLNTLTLPVCATSTTTLNKTKLTMIVGTRKQLHVKNTTKAVTWDSSKKAVASVNKKGIITAKKQGTTIITATVGKTKLKCKVTVKESPTLNKKLTICVGKKQQLTVAGTTKTIKWKSSNKNIVKVNKRGIVTGIKRGTAIISATVGTKKFLCKVKVAATVSSTNVDLSISNSGLLGVTYLSDKIYIKSSNPSIATGVIVYTGDNSELEYGLEAEIVVYGHKTGTATMTITNNFNKEKRKFKVFVKKAKDASGKQRLIDYLMSSGKNDKDSGDKYIEESYTENNAKSRITYLAADDTLHYEYTETNSDATTQWTLMSTENGGDNYYITMQITPTNTTNSYFVTATIDAKTYTCNHTTFENGWYREPVDDSLNIIANHITKNAFSKLGEMLIENTNITWQELGFLQLEQSINKE